MTVPRPVRLRLSRAKGFDLQAWSREVNDLSAVNCARPSRHGNRHKVGDGCDAAEAVRRFRADIEAALAHPLGGLALSAALRRDLASKNLACLCNLCAKHAATGKPLDESCPDCAPCHVDALGDAMRLIRRRLAALAPGR